MIGESVPSCSFHLCQLAKYGLVELAPTGRGRDKTARTDQAHQPAEVPHRLMAAATYGVAVIR